jgi:hypothetical protein
MSSSGITSAPDVIFCFQGCQRIKTSDFGFSVTGQMCGVIRHRELTK